MSNSSTHQQHSPTAGPDPQLMLGLYGQPHPYVPHDPAAYPEAVLATLPQTNRLAIGALILGIISLLLGALAGIPAIICGHLAYREIKRSQKQAGGWAFALAGLVLGYCSLPLSVLYLWLLLSSMR